MNELGIVELTEVAVIVDVAVTESGEGCAPGRALNADECDITRGTNAGFSSSGVGGDKRWVLAVSAEVEFINDTFAQLFNIADVDIISESIFSSLSRLLCCCCCCCCCC